MKRWDRDTHTDRFLLLSHRIQSATQHTYARDWFLLGPRVTAWLHTRRGRSDVDECFGYTRQYDARSIFSRARRSTLARLATALVWDYVYACHSVTN